ncbi:MAG: TIGR03545 family protein [Endomicrobia bacterium]|nr:TIGR03545 family protein [Endomicrobiia bacterium]
MKIFRWSFVVPALVIIAVVWLFFVFFFDAILKSALISAGETVFGAKVEIASVKTGFTRLSVDIRNIKIGDKDNEFKNLLDIDDINFGVRFIPLLSKKVIIDNMSVDGLKWGTARKTSCKLPPKPVKKTAPGEESFTEKMMKEIKNKAVGEVNALPGVQKFGEIQKQIGNFSPQNAMDMAGIKSAAAVKEYYVGIMGKYDDYTKKINSIDVKSKINDISALADKVSKTSVKTPADIAALKDNLAQLNAKRADLEQTYKDLKAIQDSIAKDAAAQKAALKDMSSLIESDVNNIASKLAIPTLDVKNIAVMLFGQAWVSKVDKVLYYMALVRKYLPEKTPEETKKPEPRERLKGRDIIYPRTGSLPSLWIANISLSGTSGGEGKPGTPVSFKGSVKNITSNQRLIGQITSFEASGDDTVRTINLFGSFDRLKAVAEDKISVAISGMDANMFNIPMTDYTPSFDAAKVKFAADFLLRGSDFITNAGMTITSMTYDASAKNFDGVDPNIVKYVGMIWQGINAVNVNAGISILQADGTKFNFSSDLDKLLAQRFNNVLNAALGDVKSKIKQEVTRYIDGQTKSLKADADKYGANVQSALGPKLQDVQKQLDSVKSLITQKENELKKQAMGSLISGFGK